MLDSVSFTVTAAAGAAIVGASVGWFLNNRLGSTSLDAARKRADETIRAARREGEKARRAELLRAKEEILEQRTKEDRDLRSRRGQLQKQERDIKAAHEQLDARRAELEETIAGLDDRAGELDTRAESLAVEHAKLETLIEQQTDKLSQVASLTREEAKRQLLSNLQTEVRYEAASMIRDMKEQAQRAADAEARKIITLAIERSASEVSAERSISQFKLPEGSDLRGRIIGHEGKNIRAFEAATGIQMLLDEESNTVTLSGYHPVKREIARRVLEVLIKDGNIRPKRIEELVRRHTKRLEEEMKRAGREAVKSLKLRDVHPDLVSLLGRLRFRSSYGQNVLDHSKEVAFLTGMMATELRLDEDLARRAGLMHDIGKAIDYEREGTHPEIGAEVATRCGEHETVVNAIASHHDDCEATSPISVLVAAADAVSGARPGARRQSAAQYIKRIEKLEELANSMAGVERSYALQAGREIRVIAQSRKVDDAAVDLMASDLAERIKSEMDYPGKIKVTVIREVRASQSAR